MSDSEALYTYQGDCGQYLIQTRQEAIMKAREVLVTTKMGDVSDDAIWTLLLKSGIRPVGDKTPVKKNRWISQDL